MKNQLPIHVEMIAIIFLVFATQVDSMFESKLTSEKMDFCESLQCGESNAICGIRQEGRGYHLRLFDNECELLKYGCKVDNNLAYGVISIDYCNQTFGNSTWQSAEEVGDRCIEYDCSYPTDSIEVCGIKKDGEGFRIRLFENKCQLWKHNCENDVEFTVSDFHICDGLKLDSIPKNDSNISKIKMHKNIVVVDSSKINYNDFNESIENFFAATHVFDLPMTEIHHEMNETGRRMLVKIFGPIKVFKPWITIPKNISEDADHLPTLSSCYHKCPRKCPDTYAPVCGVPGIVAREPNLMFQNHCFMDVAQCKMYLENKSSTAISSNYIESSFLFCLGDQLNGLYRFLPLIRTLQHMGRLKKKGHFRYKLSNMRFFNNLLSREPNLMG